MKLLALITFFGLGQAIFGQTEKRTISGTITDASSGETMTGAKVRVQDRTGSATISNEYGFYSLSTLAGKVAIIFSFYDFKSDTIEVDLTNNVVLNHALTSLSTEIVIEISAAKTNDNITNAQSGVEKLDMKEINKIPVLLGERDILKTMQLLPGIKTAGEGNSGLNIRGGAADQNLILLDEAPVYNASHLLGFFSTFNSDAVKDVSVFKGTQPAQYGGRLASAVDVKMKDGNNQKFGLAGGIGLIASRFNIEGPIVKNKGSFLISGRRTYADLFLKAAPDTNLRNNKLFFYDLNAKFSYRFSDKDRVFISGYFGKDILGVGNAFGINWGNTTGTLRWNHIVNQKLFSNTSFIVSNFNYNILVKAGDNNFTISSKIQDFNLKQEYQYSVNENHSLKIGANVIRHEIVPGDIEASASSGINPIRKQRQKSVESAVYFQDEWKISSRINATIGVRGSNFIVGGKGNYFTLNDKNEVIDTTVYGAGKIVKSYWNVEPRLAFSFILNESTSLKAAYGRNTQNLHLLSASTTASPTDLWVSNSNIIKPEISDQVSIGVFKNFKKDAYQFSVETYYKGMQNQIDYKDGADVQTLGAIETQLLFGIGRAYGVEMLIKKKTGKFTGWLGYTLSKSERRIEGINNNEWYNARQDRTHDVSLVLMYELTPRLNISGTFVYYTGNAVTLPAGKYVVDGVVNYQFSKRNEYRIPAYHRADIGLNWELKPKKWFTHELTFSVYNLYARENTFSIAFETNKENPEQTDAVQTALFKMIPSVTWNFKMKDLKPRAKKN